MAPRASRGEDAARAKAELVVDATLRDSGPPAPKPGVVYTVSLMRYEVVRVVRGNYRHPEIFVGHALPNLERKDLRVGARHRLYLTRQFPEHASTLDKFQTEVSKTQPFFCVSFETLRA